MCRAMPPVPKRNRGHRHEPSSPVATPLGGPPRETRHVWRGTRAGRNGAGCSPPKWDGQPVGSTGRRREVAALVAHSLPYARRKVPTAASARSRSSAMGTRRVPSPERVSKGPVSRARKCSAACSGSHGRRRPASERRASRSASAVRGRCGCAPARPRPGRVERLPASPYAVTHAATHAVTPRSPPRSPPQSPMQPPRSHPRSRPVTAAGGFSRSLEGHTQGQSPAGHPRPAGDFAPSAALLPSTGAGSGDRPVRQPEAFADGGSRDPRRLRIRASGRGDASSHGALTAHAWQ